MGKRVITALFFTLSCNFALAQNTSIHTLRECCGFGWGVSALRDVDNDGITDAIIGAKDGTSNGHVFVYSGRTGVKLRDFTLANIDTGHSVADAGDVDGDGASDVVAGSPAAGANGSVRVYSVRTGVQLLQINGLTPGSNFGQSVAGVGDQNSDGRADILVGANLGLGRAFVFSGADGTLLRTLSNTDNGGFGAGVSGFKDLNADGHMELVVAANGAAKAFVFSGIDGALLFTLNGDTDSASFGEFFVADAGDVNADGKSDVYIGDFAAAGGRGTAYVFSGATGLRLHKFTGSANEGFGTGRGAGDVDGDGFADLIIGGGAFSRPGANGAGRVQLFSGKTGANLSALNGTTSGANFGFDAVGINDVNGDGRLDFLISSSTGNRVDIVAGTIVPATPTFNISAATTGAWYDPAQTGHGLFIEVLLEQRFLAWWFTFEPDGKQAWFGGVGTYSGNRATLTALRTQGGRFIPNFDPAAVSSPQWGTLTFTLSDCNKAEVSFSSDVGFGTGAMPLTRLTSPLGLRCP